MNKTYILLQDYNVPGCHISKGTESESIDNGFMHRFWDGALMQSFPVHYMEKYPDFFKLKDESKEEKIVISEFHFMPFKITDTNTYILNSSKLIDEEKFPEIINAIERCVNTASYYWMEYANEVAKPKLYTEEQMRKCSDYFYNHAKSGKYFNSSTPFEDFLKTL